jgi:hypothetical protein
MGDGVRDARRRAFSSRSRPVPLGALVLACASPPTTSASLPGVGGQGGNGAAGFPGGAAAPSSGGTGSLIVTGGTGGAGGIELATMPCLPVDAGTPIFAGQSVMADGPAPRELYSWTTPEQVSEIRATGQLLTRTEREGLGAGFAITLLEQTALGGTDPGWRALAALLTSDPFAKARYTWPHPWATRMGWPGETYGNQLLRLVLRAEAWLVRFEAATLSVEALDGTPVQIADALAHPERIAGFYFVKDWSVGGPECGSFIGGGNGYREFVIGNEGMIEEWSLGTEVIAARLEADIANLQAFFERMRSCPEVADPTTWGALVGCSWPSSRFGTDSDQGAYEAALAMASPAYLPAPAELAALIDTLSGDLFDPTDPLVVSPEP